MQEEWSSRTEFRTELWKTQLWPYHNSIHTYDMCNICVPICIYVMFQYLFMFYMYIRSFAQEHGPFSSRQLERSSELTANWPTENMCPSSEKMFPYDVVDQHPTQQSTWNHASWFCHLLYFIYMILFAKVLATSTNLCSFLDTWVSKFLSARDFLDVFLYWGFIGWVFPYWHVRTGKFAGLFTATEQPPNMAGWKIQPRSFMVLVKSKFPYLCERWLPILSFFWEWNPPKQPLQSLR